MPSSRQGLYRVDEGYDISTDFIFCYIRNSFWKLYEKTNTI